MCANTTMYLFCCAFFFFGFSLLFLFGIFIRHIHCVSSLYSNLWFHTGSKHISTFLKMRAQPHTSSFALSLSCRHMRRAREHPPIDWVLRINRNALQSWLWYEFWYATSHRHFERRQNYSNWLRVCVAARHVVSSQAILISSIWYAPHQQMLSLSLKILETFIMEEWL